MGLAELDTYLKPDEGAPTPSDEKALVLVAPTSGIRALDKFLSEPTAMTTAQKIVRSAAPSIVGGAVGGAVGTAISPGVGTVVGTSVGSAAGEAVQQFFDPLQSGEATGSVTQIGVAGALPFVPAGLRRFFVSLPGAAAGLQDFLFKRLGTKAETLVAKFAPVAGTADDLFREVRRAGAGVSVPLTETAAATTRIAKEVAESKFATGGAKALASRAEAFVKPGAVSFDDFRLNQSDLGAVIRSLEKQGGPALGRAKLLYKSMVQDLDAALAKTKGPTAEKLGQAIDAFKREQAADFFKDAFMKSSLRRVGRQNLDVDAFMTKIDRNRDVLERLMPKAEIDDALSVLKGFAKIPTEAKTPRLGFEQMPFAQRAVVGGAIGFFAGGVPGAAGGVLAVEAVSSAMTTAPGRALVRTMMEHGAQLDQIGNALLQTGRRTIKEQP